MRKIALAALFTAFSLHAQTEYKMEGTDDNIVRVFYLTNTPTVQDFQEVATLVRTIGEIRRVFTYNSPRALVVRGTASQTALADWLVANLNQKP